MMTLVSFKCSHCGHQSKKEAGALNRALRSGPNVYCSRKCSGLGRRKGKTVAQKIAEKREYDKQYRAKNAADLKAKKAAYHQRTYDPISAVEHRKTRMAQHAEYCRRPEYRKWKREYDQRYRAKTQFGEFWESAILANQIRQEALGRMTDYEIRIDKGTLGKSQQRKRDYEKRQKLISAIPETGPLGNLARRSE